MTNTVIARLHHALLRLQTVLEPLALLALRLPVAVVFWRSARTKVEGWNIFAPTDGAFFLFQHEYGLPFPVLSTYAATLAEHVLPVLLVLGLATRLGALGMLVMTLVIQIFVYPDAWLSAHMFWATILFAVLALGPGKLSLDHLIARRLPAAL
ncbi:MAG: DoxX family protein [Alphaproteobacteria bacterium]|nr:DoxX family protein [Alphaproteobacteria bacterium]MBU0798783.1 DoxX family protein [Alphaproteobacteria bacterium]MBU0886046.1 DoxX family protein [Alphaproteobacteria bacterium]MBU1812035.1 DoxX family protein [Alphaproteobacteria bacterium]